MTTLELKAYDIFKAKLGEKEAEVVMELFQAKAAQAVGDAKDAFITAKDKDTLLTVATAKDLFATKDEMHREFGAMMRWMIGLFIPLYLSIIGLFVTILLKK